MKPETPKKPKAEQLALEVDELAARRGHAPQTRERRRLLFRGKLNACDHRKWEWDPPEKDGDTIVQIRRCLKCERAYEVTVTVE